jgi:hypothetical protein
MGGNARRIGPQRKFFGLMPSDETFVVGFSRVEFDDSSLAFLASNYADRIGALVKPVVALARLQYLSIRGCQIPYDDVEQIRANMPALRIDQIAGAQNQPVMGA